MRELTHTELAHVSGGHVSDSSPGMLSADNQSGQQFTDGQCVAAGAGMGLAGGVGAIGVGMTVGSVIPGAGTLAGGLAGLLVATASGIFTWVCTETNNETDGGESDGGESSGGDDTGS